MPGAPPRTRAISHQGPVLAGPWDLVGTRAVSRSAVLDETPIRLAANSRASPWIEVTRCSDTTWLLFPDERGMWHARRLTSEVQALLACCETPTPPWAITATIAAASNTDPEEIGPWVRE